MMDINIILEETKKVNEQIHELEDKISKLMKNKRDLHHEALAVVYGVSPGDIVYVDDKALTVVGLDLIFYPPPSDKNGRFRPNLRLRRHRKDGSVGLNETTTGEWKTAKEAGK